MPKSSRRQASGGAVHHRAPVAGYGLALVGRSGRRYQSPAPARRLSGCFVAQDMVHARGFPCPEPLVAPAPLGALSATAERHLPGGEALAAAPHTTELYASALARLLACAPAPTELPSVEPAPPWAAWDHGEPGVWPVPDDRHADLNAHAGPRWLDDLCRARPCPPGQCHRARCHWACGLGSTNVRGWGAAPCRPRLGQHRCRPEATIVGLAAAVHTASGEPLTEATDDQIDGFLTGLQPPRSRPHHQRTRVRLGRRLVGTGVQRRERLPRRRCPQPRPAGCRSTPSATPGRSLTTEARGQSTRATTSMSWIGARRCPNGTVNHNFGAAAGLRRQHMMTPSARTHCGNVVAALVGHQLVQLRSPRHQASPPLTTSEPSDPRSHRYV